MSTDNNSVNISSEELRKHDGNADNAAVSSEKPLLEVHGVTRSFGLGTETVCAVQTLKRKPTQMRAGKN